MQQVIDYQQYRKQWNLAGTGVLTDAPIHIDIELASACNFRCPMCPQAEIPSGFTKDFMDKKLAVRILKEAKDIGVSSVKLNWRGESTIHPDFCEIVSDAYWLNFTDLMINTNGSYTTSNTRDAMEFFNMVIFSIDTIDEEKAFSIRPGGPLKTVMKNFEILATSKMDFGVVDTIRVNFTKQKENWDEEETVKKYVEGWGAQFYSKPVFPRNPPKVGAYFDESKIKVNGRKNCGFPFQRLTIAWDGRVAPCCIPWLDDLYVGDVTKQSINEIWNSKAISDIRNDAKMVNYKHPVCVNCTSWASYNINIK